MTFFAARRIAVCGSSDGLNADAAKFCQELGQALGRQPNIILVSRGIKKSIESESGNLAADYYFIEGARKSIEHADLDSRIETHIEENNRHDLFKVGKLLPAQGKSKEARRFFMISQVDALVAIGGNSGTEQQLRLANALDMPILPIPYFGGSSFEFWKSHQAEVTSRLKLDKRGVQLLNSKLPDKADAERLIRMLFGAMQRRCFVIMPFDEDLKKLYLEAIAPAVMRSGDEPIRLDETQNPGDITDQILIGITNCDYAIAVVDRKKPNVFYELGLAHAKKKPTIIVGHETEGGLPFDLFSHRRIVYRCVDDDLTSKIADAIATIPGSRRNPRKPPTAPPPSA